MAMNLFYSLCVVENCLSVQPVRSPVAKGEALTGTFYPARVMPLLKELPAGRKSDRRILTFLAIYERQKGCLISGEHAGELLNKLIDTGRAYWLDNRRKPITLGDPVKSGPSWHYLEDEERICPGYQVESNHILLPCSPPAVIDPETMCIHPLQAGLPKAACTEWQAARPMKQEACAAFLDRLHARHRDASFPPPPSIKVEEREGIQPQPVIRLLQDLQKNTNQRDVRLLLGLSFDYATANISYIDERQRIRVIRDDRLLDISRDFDSEKQYQQQLEQLGLVPYEDRSGDLFKRHEHRDCFVPSPTSSHNWQDLLNTVFPDLEQQGWHIETSDVELVSVKDEDWYSDISTGAKHWFAFETGIAMEDQRINLLPFIHDYLKERRDWDLSRFKNALAKATLPLNFDQQILLIPGQRILEIIEYLFELHSDSALTANGRLRLNLFRVAELRQALELTQDFSEHPEIEALSAVLKQGLTIKPVREPKGLQAKLRPYQKTGVAWLDFLRAHRMGGILADDMGLGKTLQTLALLQREKNGKRLDHPALIVVPTSVLPNWRNELRNFAPGLTFHYHHGADRHDKTQQGETHDLLLTTYALIRRDAEWFQDQTFSWIILDEAQAIKNPRSQTALTLNRMNSTHRLCLTGTPMENHLGELWSLFHFLTPGFLGGHDTFRKHFQRPIEGGAPMLQTALKRRIRPFLLRRTKSEVEQDLPDKIEILETLALTERQHNLYEIIRMAMTQRIQEEMQAKGFARSKLMILHALLKLRQICCDPRLAKQEEKSIEKDSCKITWLRNRLPGMIEDGRRILLFSQFTSMLALIENLLNSLHIPYVQLTGSTSDRDTPVQQFQNGEAPVFLLSLKAGGTGLNLTAADTVIHYDPWWNPAAERQATDRAHRIGQDKSVFVYKLITSTSIEERILDMQRRKAQLADSMLDAAARDSKLTFSEEDLQYLLAPLPGAEQVNMSQDK